MFTNELKSKPVEKKQALEISLTADNKIAHLEALRFIDGHQSFTMQQVVDVVKQLKVENDRLRIALEFYASPEKWNSVPKLNSAAFNDVLQIGAGNGWDRAKQALKGDS